MGVVVCVVVCLPLLPCICDYVVTARDPMGEETAQRSGTTCALWKQGQLKAACSPGGTARACPGTKASALASSPPPGTVSAAETAGKAGREGIQWAPAPRTKAPSGGSVLRCQSQSHGESWSCPPMQPMGAEDAAPVPAWPGLLAVEMHLPTSQGDLTLLNSSDLKDSTPSS